MAKAEVVAKNRSAEAQHEAIKAVFDARIVQVNSERMRDASELFRTELFKVSTLEATLAEAQASRSETAERLAGLRKEQERLQSAAQQNWDARLARFRSFQVIPTPQETSFALDNQLNPELQSVQVTNVPTSVESPR